MRICFIGDSFVNGLGDDACLGWAGRVCVEARRRGVDITFYNLGVRRDTSANIAARWEREARARVSSESQEQDGRLVFSFGVNDCLVEGGGAVLVPEEAALANARRILGAASAWLPTLMVGPPPIADEEVNRRSRALSQKLEAVCGELGVPFLSVWDGLADEGTWVREAAAGDGAHPNSGGYAALAEMVGAWPAWRAWVK